MNLFTSKDFLAQVFPPIGEGTSSPIQFPDVSNFQGGEFLKYLISPELQHQLLPIKIVFIVILFAFLMMIIYFFLNTTFANWWFLRGLIDFIFPKSISKKKLSKKWDKNKDKLEKGISVPEWKDPLIEAFNIFDRALEDVGYQGQTVGEKVEKLTEEEISNPEEVKNAIEMCRDIIRDPDYKLSKEEAREGVEAFEKALEDLELI